MCFHYRIGWNVTKVAQSRLSKASRRRRAADPVLPNPRPDLHSIMEHFNRGLSLLVVCQRSLVEVDEAVHEEQVMRDAIAIFRDVYEEIDAAERLIYRAGG
jgi:hypothetical protein